MRISVGELDVLDSGVVISPNDSPIKFELVHEEETLFVTINFSESTEKDDKGKPLDTSQARLVSESEMDIVLSGWDNSLGVAPVDSWEIGSIGGRKLELQMRVSGIKGASGVQRMFAYTWLLGDSL